jgi:hypothetical protein
MECVAAIIWRIMPLEVNGRIMHAPYCMAWSLQKIWGSISLSTLYSILLLICSFFILLLIYTCILLTYIYMYITCPYCYLYVVFHTVTYIYMYITCPCITEKRSSSMLLGWTNETKSAGQAEREYVTSHIIPSIKMCSVMLKECQVL